LAPLTDSLRLQAYTDALQNWAVTGYIQFALNEEAIQWIHSEFGNISLKEIGRLMYQYVARGGEIDEVRETRSEWKEQHEFHYDLRFTIHEKIVYVETRLNFREPLVADDSWILVVNIHAK
jgi:hypothetical protein